MKRLSDERVLQIQEDEGAGRVDNHDYATGDDLDSLFRDHLQAREDVKRLATLLRADATKAPDGTLCWCGDGEVNSYCWNDPGGRSPFCVERSVVLFEVDP